MRSLVHNYQLSSMKLTRPSSKVYKYIGKTNLVDKTNNYLLANNSRCTIIGNMYFKDKDGFLQSRDFTFPSAEHFWWAHFLSRRCDIQRFSVGGDIYDKIGTEVKMISKLTNGKREKAISMGLEMSVTPFEAYGENKKSTIESIWNKIINSKFLQNPEHRRKLLSTGDNILVEFCKKDSDVGFWNGTIKNGKIIDEFTIKGGKLIGGNFIGKCLMACRKNTSKLSLKPFAKLTPKVVRSVSYQFEYEY